MKSAYVFPGQASQYPGMGKKLYDNNQNARKLFDFANEILNFNITELMFYGNEEDIKQTKVTQPAVFLHSVIQYLCLDNFPKPTMVAGHSLGEFSALVANGVLKFEDALTLVLQRATAMQKACEITPSTMAAVLNLSDEIIEKILSEIDEIVVSANYNCPGQVVISGTEKGIDIASEKLKLAGARRILKLMVGGAFHSPIMMPAQIELEKAINKIAFSSANCPIYQNFDASPHFDADIIKENLKNQLVNPVKWTMTIRNMRKDGVEKIYELAPGKVLSGLISKIDKEIVVEYLDDKEL